MVELGLASYHLATLGVLTTSDSPKHIQLHSNSTGHRSKPERPHTAYQAQAVQREISLPCSSYAGLTLQHYYVGLPFSGNAKSKKRLLWKKRTKARQGKGLQTQWTARESTKPTPQPRTSSLLVDIWQSTAGSWDHNTPQTQKAFHRSLHPWRRFSFS